MYNNMSTLNFDVCTGASSEPLYFYNRDEKYYEFTNFYASPIELDGNQWPTTEHYFQAQKFIGTQLVEIIRQKKYPRDVFEYAQKPDIACQCRKDWKEVKVQVMKKALVAKFTQHMMISASCSWALERENLWGGHLMIHSGGMEVTARAKTNWGSC